MSGLDVLIDAIADRPQWMRRAACAGVGPDMFYPDQYRKPTVALTICEACPVQLDCLEHAQVTRERFGVWGGVVMRRGRKKKEQVS